MFRVYANNTALSSQDILIYDDCLDDEQYSLSDPKLHMEVNAAGSFEFTINSKNNGYQHLIPMVTELLVYKDNMLTRNHLIWFGRILTVSTDIYGDKTIYCEGGLSYLNDIVYGGVHTGSTSWWNVSRSVGKTLCNASYRYKDSGFYIVDYNDLCYEHYKRTRTGIEWDGTSYLKLLRRHPLRTLGLVREIYENKMYTSIWDSEPVIANSSKDEAFYFASTVSETGQNYSDVSDPNGSTLLDILASMMEKSGGYYWVTKSQSYFKSDRELTDSAVNVMTLHLSRSARDFVEPQEGLTAGSQTWDISENISALTIDEDGSDFFTAIRPYYTSDTSGEVIGLSFTGTQTTYANKRKCTFDASLGIAYVDDFVEKYGLIIKNLDCGTGGISEMLVGYSLTYLDSISVPDSLNEKNYAVGVREISITGVDISMYNPNYASVELMDCVRVISKPHGIDAYMTVSAIEYDLANIENSVYTLKKRGQSISSSSTSSGSQQIASNAGYVHPTYRTASLGFRKVEVDRLGHVSQTSLVSKKDITSLGIPGEDTNTTYELSREGTDIKMTGSDGSQSSVSVSDIGKKYRISGLDLVNPKKIVLTDSDGKTTEVYTDGYKRTIELVKPSSDVIKALGNGDRGVLWTASAFQIKMEGANYDDLYNVTCGFHITDSDGSVFNEIVAFNIRQHTTKEDGQILYGVRTIGDLPINGESIDVYAYATGSTDLTEMTYTYTMYFAIYSSVNIDNLGSVSGGMLLTYTDNPHHTNNVSRTLVDAIEASKLVKQNSVSALYTTTDKNKLDSIELPEALTSEEISAICT